MGMPMPKGKVRINKSDGESIEFIGEDQIDHTPKDEKINLHVGDAFDVLAEEKVADTKKISDNVHEYSYEVKLKNRKDEDITVEVERSLWGNWEVLNSNFDYEKNNANKITFKVPVKKSSEQTLKYTVRFSN